MLPEMVFPVKCPRCDWFALTILEAVRFEMLSAGIFDAAEGAYDLIVD
jgi:hypothetical protein